MSVGRVYLVWALLALGVLALMGGLLGRWYGFESETPEGFGGTEDFAAPDYQLHTDLWREGHGQLEGMTGGTADEEGLPQIGQVLGVVRVFYLVGLAGVLFAGVGVLFRLRGLPDSKGLVASVGTLALASLLFAVVFFAVGIAPAYNDALENVRGESPEIAFYTFGTDSEEGAWQNVASGPLTGWYLAVIGTTALVAAFVAAFSAEVRRVREVLTDDQAARAHREAHLREVSGQGVARFRREDTP